MGNGSLPRKVHQRDAIAHQAQIDANTAYTILASQSSTGDLTGQDLGGLTLTPGVYFFSSSAQLTGILTLDALNDPNALFVFQIGGAFKTASNSVVKMRNGEVNDRIFWQVGNSANLGNSTLFLGNILANQSITLNTTTKILDGRVIALNGAVKMNANTISQGSDSLVPLPVTHTAAAETLVQGIVRI